MSKLILAVKHPGKAVAYGRYKAVHWYISLVNAIKRTRPNEPNHDAGDEFREVAEFSQNRSDISDHLLTMFSESLRRRPKMIVELGVRRGSSTFVFERVARLCSSILLSVDIEDCSEASTYANWHFMHADDLVFGAEFPAWCREKAFPETIDVLFIDTSHTYEHTIQEIATWFNHLSEKALVIFHDTNMKEIYRRLDGTLGHGPVHERGVIQAVHEFLSFEFDENKNFSGEIGNWSIRHFAHCSGLTVLEKLT